MSKIGLIAIATGPLYQLYVRNMLTSARKYFPEHESILFTDTMEPMGADITFVIPPMGFPDATLYRYHTLLKRRGLLSQFTYLFYLDADSLMMAPIEESEILAPGITATEHPGYVGLPGSPEIRPESACYCPHPEKYYCGGFNGGLSTDYLTMADKLKFMIDQDIKNGIIPLWHDESALVKYLFDNPPAKTLDPSFCYPESEYKNPGGYYSQIWQRASRTNITPKILALDKERP